MPRIPVFHLASQALVQRIDLLAFVLKRLFHLSLRHGLLVILVRDELAILAKVFLSALLVNRLVLHLLLLFLRDLLLELLVDLRISPDVAGEVADCTILPAVLSIVDEADFLGRALLPRVCLLDQGLPFVLVLLLLLGERLTVLLDLGFELFGSLV